MKMRMPVLDLVYRVDPHIQIGAQQQRFGDAVCNYGLDELIAEIDSGDVISSLFGGVFDDVFMHVDGVGAGTVQEVFGEVEAVFEDIVVFVEIAVEEMIGDTVHAEEAHGEL